MRRPDLKECPVTAPASMCKRIQKNDRVIKVDDKAVDEHGSGLTKMLLGCDIPGDI